MCAPEIKTDLQRPDYWVECRPCGYRSEDFLSFKDCAAAYAEHSSDVSYCKLGDCQSCSGYTEDERDPETCMCSCHDEIGAAL